MLIKWITAALNALNYSKRFMAWNLFLAFVPLVLSIWLFHKHRSRSILWWIVFIICIAFLPNAPYVLTDIIHLIELIRSGSSIWIVTLVLIPQYLIFILAGVEAYVISLMKFGNYLSQQGYRKYILSIELITHALCAVGIYLGRFKRFNSWDFITQPNSLVKSIINDLTNKQPILVIIITFLVLGIMYWLFKQLNLSIIFRIRYQKVLKQRLENG